MVRNVASDEHPLTVSVVIAHYNQPDLLQQCLEAISHQSVPAHEVIIVDDGSLDRPITPITWAQPSRVTLIDAEHRGPAAARNLGADRATGQIIAFTDCDCRPDPVWLETMVRFFASNVEVVATTGPIADATAKHTINPLHRFMHQIAPLDLVPQYFEYASIRMLGLIGANLFVRTKAFRTIGGFDDQYPRPGGEDYDLALRLQQTGWLTEFVHSAVVNHDYPTSTMALVRRWNSYGIGKAVFAHKHGIERAHLHLLDSPTRFFTTNIVDLVRLTRRHFGSAFGHTRFPWITAMFVEACFQWGARTAIKKGMIPAQSSGTHRTNDEA